MKQFSLVLNWTDPNDNFKFKFSDQMEADNLVQLLTQFQFTIVRVMEKMKEEQLAKIKYHDDDIPF